MARWLIACETSGRVRDALRTLGHDAVSCDLLPTVRPGPHIIGDARDHFRDGWDGMVAHPVCTKLTVAAAWTMYHPDDKNLPYEQRRPHPDYPNRRAEQDEAASDFMDFMGAPIERVLVENPVGAMSTRYRKPDQIVQPYQFGDNASKKTCFWRRKVAPIEIPPKTDWYPPRIVMDPKLGREMPRWGNQTDSGQNRLGPSADRWSVRSETYPGIAAGIAMACDKS